MSTQVNNQVALLYQEVVTSSTSAHFNRKTMANGQRVSRQRPISRLGKTISTVVYSYRTPLGTLYAKRNSKGVQAHDDEKSPHEVFMSEDEYSLTFTPSFLSRCIEFKYLSSLGYISGSFRVAPVIPRNHPVWKMCEEGDIQGLQTCFGDRTVSPFSIDQSGGTLLHVREPSYEVSDRSFEHVYR